MQIDIAECVHCHCLAARRRARKLTRACEAKLRAHGLRATQFSILAALAIGGPKPLGRLARALDLERTTLTRAAGLLERKGWVEAEAGENDARERLLRLTGAGRRKLEAAYPAWKAMQQEVERTSMEGAA